MFKDASTSNLATSSINKRQISDLRDHMFQTGERLASGHKLVPEIARDGRSIDLYAMDRELHNIEQHLQDIDSIDLRLSVVQSTIKGMRTNASAVSLGVLASLNEKPASNYLAEARNANGALDSIVSSLNQSVAGQSLFSGARLDTSALVGSQQLISDVEAILVAAPDLSTALSDLDFYFNDPAGGFVLNSYLGASSDGPSIEIASGQYIQQNIRADHPAIRETIQNLAIIAAVSNGVVPSPSDQKTLLKSASERNLNTNEALIFVQQDIGYYQEQLEQSSASNLVKQTVVEQARNKITSVDLFEEAAKFEELQIQLETSCFCGSGTHQRLGEYWWRQR